MVDKSGTSPRGYPQVPEAGRVWIPGHALRVKAGDKIQVSSYAGDDNTGYIISARLLLDDGRYIPIQRDVTHATGGQYEFAFLDLDEGWLTGLIVGPTGSLAPLSFRCMASLVPNELGNISPLYTLISGYSDVQNPAFWPGKPSSLEFATQGDIGNNQIANPAAGADYSSGLNSNYSYQITSINMTFTADANVANRRPRLALVSGGNYQLDLPSAAAITAGQAVSLTWGIGLENIDYSGVCQTMPLPLMGINGVTAIATNTDNIQVGDQYSSLSYTYKSWLP